MAKTVRQALIDEISYPLSVGFIENKLLARGLNAEELITPEIIKSKGFKGATADCLYELIVAPNISEAGKSISLGDREIILRRVNSLYNSIGEESVAIDEPTVHFGWPKRK